jgi:hypothetical protein
MHNWSTYFSASRYGGEVLLSPETILSPDFKKVSRIRKFLCLQDPAPSINKQKNLKIKKNLDFKCFVTS